MTLADDKPTILESSLTKRQLEILFLIREGKSNKEIASVLDISLGTVKQHIAVLFKKLDIHNRSMAVAVADKLMAHEKSDLFSSSSPYLLARRPAVVLSFEFGALNQKAHRKINTALADIAFDFDGHHVNHSAYSADIVFGLKRSSEQDIVAALVAINKIDALFETFGLNSGKEACHLSAAIAVGFILVSQHRYGGWSGETVAGPVIAEAHKLLLDTDNHFVHFSLDAQKLLFAFDFDLYEKALWSFKDVKEILCWKRLISPPLIGQKHLIDRLLSGLTLVGRCVGVFGESGMGKSRLCRELALTLTGKGHKIEYFKVLPSGCLDMVRGGYIEFINTIPIVCLNDSKYVSTVIFDDVHLLSDSERQSFFDVVKVLAQFSRIVVSGRYVVEPSFSFLFDSIKLTRLNDVDASVMISNFGASTEEDESIRCLSRNVPLFIKELSADQVNVSIALMTVVASRLDMFNLDWKLLYILTKSSGVAGLDKIKMEVGDVFDSSIKAAVDAGVLVVESGCVKYKNPLVEKVIESLFLVESGF